MTATVTIQVNCWSQSKCLPDFTYQSTSFRNSLLEHSGFRWLELGCYGCFSEHTQEPPCGFPPWYHSRGNLQSWPTHCTTSRNPWGYSNLATLLLSVNYKIFHRISCCYPDHWRIKQPDWSDWPCHSRGRVMCLKHLGTSQQRERNGNHGWRQANHLWRMELARQSHHWLRCLLLPWHHNWGMGAVWVPTRNKVNWFTEVNRLM